MAIVAGSTFPAVVIALRAPSARASQDARAVFSPTDERL